VGDCHYGTRRQAAGTFLPLSGPKRTKVISPEKTFDACQRQIASATLTANIGEAYWKNCLSEYQDQASMKKFFSTLENHPEVIFVFCVFALGSFWGGLLLLFLGQHD
jgi:hypothetical protein